MDDTAVSPRWLSPPDRSELSSGELHIWRAYLLQPEAIRQQLATTLAPDEAERAARFHFDRHRHAFIVARGFLRDVLGRYMRRPAAQIRFDYGPRGKPALADPADLQFNLSHAGDWALLAVTRGREVGIDLEPVRRQRDADQIATRFFSAAENHAYHALPEAQRPQGFFNCWTRKEAYIKAIGDGLAQPLDQFDVTLRPGEAARLVRVAGDPAAAAHWHMLALVPAIGYAAAACVAGSSIDLTCWHWSPTGN